MTSGSIMITKAIMIPVCDEGALYAEPRQLPDPMLLIRDDHLATSRGHYHTCLKARYDTARGN
jgi:hypothetical protein